MRAVDIIRHPIKAARTLRTIPFQNWSGGLGNLSQWQDFFDNLGLNWQGERINYARDIGDLANTQLMASAIRWVAKNVNDARLYVGSKDSSGKVSEIQDHPMIMLLNTPNDYYSGTVLWKGVIASRLTRATSYIRKVRNFLGQPIQLWWEPSFDRYGQVATRPRWDNGEFISYYEVLRDGVWYRVDVEDMIVLRDGLNPDTREGFNGVASLWSEFYTDKHASRYMANLMRHGLVPPVAIGVGNATTPGPKGDAWETMKKEIDRQFREGASTKPFKFTGPVKVEKLGFDYSSVGMRDVRRIPEERFCAVLGISPQSLRLGLGQENSTYANVENYTRLDYNDFIKPLHGEICDELRKQLLPDFGDVEGLRLEWDYSNVQILQPDQNAEWDRLEKAYLAGGLMRSEFREAMGYKFDSKIKRNDEGIVISTEYGTDDVYMMPRGGSLLRPDEVASAAPAVDVTAPPLEDAAQKPQMPLKRVPPKSEIDAAVDWWAHTQDPNGAALIDAKAN